MSTLRERVAEKTRHNVPAGFYNPVENALKVADAILSLPSGLEVVVLCHCNAPEATAPCDCHGAGEIRRDLSIQEAIEYLQWKVQNDHEPLFLPEGPRIRVRR